MATNTAPLSPPARDYHTAQTHYLRKTVAFNTVVSGSSVTVGVVPASSVVLRACAVVTTVFDAGTTNTISIGVAGATAGLLSAADIGTTAGVKISTLISTAASAVIFPTTELAIIATYGRTGTAPSAGSAVVIVEYANVN